MILPGNFGGWIALLIGISIWVLVIAAVVIAFKDSESDKKTE